MIALTSKVVSLEERLLHALCALVASLSGLRALLSTIDLRPNTHFPSQHGL